MAVACAINNLLWSQKHSHKLAEQETLFRHDLALKNIEYGRQGQELEHFKRELKDLREACFVFLEGYECGGNDDLLEERIGTAEALPAISKLRVAAAIHETECA